MVLIVWELFPIFNYLYHHNKSSHLRCSIKEGVFIFNINSILNLIDIDTESSLLFSFFVYEKSSRPEVLCKKSALKNLSKFTGKRLCQSLFFNKVARNSGTGIFLSTSSTEHLLMTTSVINKERKEKSAFGVYINNVRIKVNVKNKNSNEVSLLGMKLIKKLILKVTLLTFVEGHHRNVKLSLELGII